jgi:prephenate dehydratase
VRCYDLLYEYGLKIVGEVVRPIHHCLIGCQGSIFEDLRKVQSHPVALAQCERFFRVHPTITRRVAEDTAGSVRDVMEKQDMSLGAIAGEHAASVYGAQVLLRNIEDYPENFTRFVLLGDGQSEKRNTDKQSLAVKLWHEPGSLFRALKPFALHDVNLVNLLCRPLKRTPWHYLFFVDLVAPEEARREAIEELTQFAEEVRMLGCYKAAALG